MNEYFVDSTVWIEFFKGGSKEINDFLMPLIDEDRVFYNGIILTELLIGAINEKEYNFLRENFEGFKYLEIDRNTFKETSQIGFNLRRNGVTIPITDLMITAHCIKHNLTIVTKDKHFKLINEKLKLRIKYF